MPQGRAECGNVKHLPTVQLQNVNLPDGTVPTLNPGGLDPGADVDAGTCSVRRGEGRLADGESS